MTRQLALSGQASRGGNVHGCVLETMTSWLEHGFAYRNSGNRVSKGESLLRS